MPAERSSKVSPPQRTKKQEPTPRFITPEDWNLARPRELRRFDSIPTNWTTRNTNLVSFGDSTDDLQLDSDWESLITDTVYWYVGGEKDWEPRLFTYPRCYRFFLHYLQAAAKFYIEVGDNLSIPLALDIPALGFQFLWLATGFVEEVVSNVDAISGTWRSQVLHPFICRLFYNIPEDNVAREIEMVRQYTLSSDPKTEDFEVFYAQDLLQGDLRNAWRMRYNGSPETRFFTQYAGLYIGFEKEGVRAYDQKEWADFADFCEGKYNSTEAPARFLPSQLQEYRSLDEVVLTVDQEEIVLSVDAPTKTERQRVPGYGPRNSDRMRTVIQSRAAKRSRLRSHKEPNSTDGHWTHKGNTGPHVATPNDDTVLSEKVKGSRRAELGVGATVSTEASSSKSSRVPPIPSNQTPPERPATPEYNANDEHEQRSTPQIQGPQLVNDENLDEHLTVETLEKLLHEVLIVRPNNNEEDYETAEKSAVCAATKVCNVFLNRRESFQRATLLTQLAIIMRCPEPSPQLELMSSMANYGKKWATVDAAPTVELDCLAAAALIYAIRESVFRLHPLIQDPRTVGDMAEILTHLQQCTSTVVDQRDDRALASKICILDSHGGEMSQPDFMRVARQWADGWDILGRRVPMKIFFDLEITLEEKIAHLAHRIAIYEKPPKPDPVPDKNSCTVIAKTGFDRLLASWLIDDCSEDEHRMRLLEEYLLLLSNLWKDFPLSDSETELSFSLFCWAGQGASIDDEDVDIHSSLLCKAVVDGFFTPSLKRPLGSNWEEDLDVAMNEATASLTDMVLETGYPERLELKNLLDLFVRMLASNCASKYPTVSKVIVNFFECKALVRDLKLVYAALQGLSPRSTDETAPPMLFPQHGEADSQPTRKRMISGTSELEPPSKRAQHLASPTQPRDVEMEDPTPAKGSLNASPKSNTRTNEDVTVDDCGNVQPGRFVLGVAGVDLGDQETNDSARDLSKPAATNKVKIALKSRSMQGRP